MRWFHADSFSKAVIAGGGAFGLVISPWIVSAVANLGWPTSKAASRLAAIGAGSFLVAALFPFLPVYVIACVCGMSASSAIIPLLTQMYQENYPESERGRRFSRTLMIRIATAAIFSQVAGKALTGRIEQFPWLLLIFAGAFASASFCLARCPTRKLTRSAGTHPFRALSFVRHDPLFRLTLICWMLMGFATLMMQPLRVEYLANPKYKMELTVGMIAMLTGVIPNIARLVLSPIWGWLFDHVNFFVLRVTLNMGFALGILSFFTSDSLKGLIFAAVIFGISNAGGDVAWYDRLEVGDVVTRTSTILGVEEKAGRSGPLTFVTVAHEISSERGVAEIFDHAGHDIAHQIFVIDHEHRACRGAHEPRWVARR